MARKSSHRTDEWADGSMVGNQFTREQEAGQPASAQPAPNGSWFDRTQQHLVAMHLIDHPDEIVTFSHSPHHVTVRLSNGREYCLTKERL